MLLSGNEEDIKQIYQLKITIMIMTTSFFLMS